MSNKTFSAYRIMWIIVVYDLPTHTKKQRKSANQFRKKLQGFGFRLFQWSMYIRHCPSREKMEMQKSRVEKIVPAEGKICIMDMTDKQFGEIQIFHGGGETEMPDGPTQLLLF